MVGCHVVQIFLVSKNCFLYFGAVFNWILVDLPLNFYLMFAQEITYKKKKIPGISLNSFQVAVRQAEERIKLCENCVKIGNVHDIQLIAIFIPRVSCCTLCCSVYLLLYKVFFFAISFWNFRSNGRSIAR